MSRDNISAVFARNLKAAMAEARQGRGVSQLQLSKDSGVPQTTISLFLRPERRVVAKEGISGSPTIERVARLAAALNIEPWLLLHPDMERAHRESDFYRRIEDDYRKFPKRDPTG